MTKRRKRKIRIRLIEIAVVLTLLIIASVFGLSLIRKTDEVEPLETLDEPQPRICVVRNHEKVYLALGEKYLLDDEGYVAADQAIAGVNGNIVTGKRVGTTTLDDGCNIYDVEVTDMITAPYVDADKEMLPCERYTVEENEKLDEILAGKIREKGYQTRAGAVEAGRFLLLQFPYHMDYFSENGRYPWCDGEGRYYHEGLYLNVYKAENFTNIMEGPAPWGCLFYSIPAEINQRNSLDCSGFVTWCLVNGGFDPGDLGAGPMEGVMDMSDLGDHHLITEKSLDEVKVGDLFSAEGHISILIGKKDGIYYIAESDLPIDVRVRVTTKEELCNCDFNFWVDMDEFYGYRDGELTDYWME